MLQSRGPLLKQGLLEKRSDGLLQLWKKKLGVLTGDGLLLLPPKQVMEQPLEEHGEPGASGGYSGAKELLFGDMKTVDSVERKGKYIYFTVVMADKRELDFRCSRDTAWNALITLGMVQYQNRRAMEAVQCSRKKLAQRGIGPGIADTA
ncbi:pleckstrin homology-like domain family A member 1 [Chiloscyllium punctatum]|uniref:PH domain-containing protein n=1 Tax=Chiloscyllium punctatum TaxID=137246 RepID=A0A401TVS8_CHIPU|nr:hypothetical protein [Chiloscyllium punctatum]